MEFLLFGHKFLEPAEFLVDEMGFFDPDFTGQVALDLGQLVGVYNIIEIIDEFLQVILSSKQSLLEILDIFMFRVQRRKFSDTLIDGDFFKQVDN